jgi:TonB-linked SusC/RagA family outer membrane protein
MSVLKDAAAVAIYGSRGSNGVILINTKKGKRNQATQFAADWYTGWVEPTVIRDMMNADQYREYSANAYQGQFGLNVTPADFPQTSFDWPSAVLRTGRTDNYSVTARGGSENTSFFVGGTYFKQKGFTIGNAGDRVSFRLNMDHSATDNLRFGANIGVTRLEYDRLDQDNSTFAPLTTSYLQVPWVEPTDANGEFVNTGFLANVIGIEATSTFLQIQRRTTGNFYGEWDIIEGLTFKSDFGVDIGQNEETQRYPDVFSPGGYGYKRIWQDNKYLITNTLRYDKDINDDMRFSILAGHSYEENRNEVIQVEATGYVSDQLPNVGSGSTPSTTSATGSDWAIESLFTRINYSFMDKYLVEGTLRRDGSSRFGANNRYGNFWAASAGWIISEESFLSGIDAINLLKLKVSYGTSGNDQIGNFASLGLYGAGTVPSYNGTPGIEPSNPANPDITWEETTQLDISLTAGLFDNRVNIDASYYVKDTDGLLLAVPVPSTTGFTSRTENIGEIRNKGVDLQITGDIVRGSDLSVTSTLNLGFLTNEVTSLPDDNQDAQGNNFVGGSAAQRAIQGYSINQFYLIPYVGIDPATGEATWLDIDGNITNTPTANDRRIQGSAIPDLTGSFRTDVKYLGFDFSFLFTFVQGNYVQLDDMRFTDNPNNFDFFGLSTRLLDTWEQPGDIAYAPGFSATTFRTYAQRSTAQNFDGSYVRLKNITLGYSLPSSVLDKTFIDRARVYVMGTNLWTGFSDLWDFGVEPEVNGGAADPGRQGESFFTAPMPKTISVGVSLGF